MKAIIVTHPTQNWKACLYGLDYDKLSLLAEFRANNTKTIKKRYSTVTYTDATELLKKYNANKISCLCITESMYQAEIGSYFKLFIK